VEPAGQETRVDNEPEPRLAQLERENQDLRAEVIEARHRLLVNRDHVVGTEAEIGRLNRDVLRMQGELITARKKIRALQKDKSGLVGRNQDLRSKLQATRARAESLRAALDREVAARVPLSRTIVRRLRGGRRR
jgi:predicted  nucleic acid-binding Zn-ribbon protein